LKDFVSYVITSGQDTAQQLSYAKLPQSVQQQNEKLVNEMASAGGTQVRVLQLW
jgi:hypothetical protein